MDTTNTTNNVNVNSNLSEEDQAKLAEFQAKEKAQAEERINARLARYAKRLIDNANKNGPMKAKKAELKGVNAEIARLRKVAQSLRVEIKSMKEEKSSNEVVRKPASKKTTKPSNSKRTSK